MVSGAAGKIAETRSRRCCLTFEFAKLRESFIRDSVASLCLLTANLVICPVTFIILPARATTSHCCWRSVSSLPNTKKKEGDTRGQAGSH